MVRRFIRSHEFPVAGLYGVDSPVVIPMRTARCHGLGSRGVRTLTMLHGGRYPADARTSRLTSPPRPARLPPRRWPRAAPNMQNMITRRERAGLVASQACGRTWGTRKGHGRRTIRPRVAGFAGRGPAPGSPRAADQLGQPIPGFDHARHKLGRVPPPRDRPAAVGAARRGLPPPCEGILDQRPPPRIEHVERVRAGGFLGRDLAGRDRVVEPRRAEHPGRRVPPAEHRRPIQPGAAGALDPAAPVAVQVAERPRPQLGCGRCGSAIARAPGRGRRSRVVRARAR